MLTTSDFSANRNPSVKSFLDYEDASAFAAGRDPPSANSERKPPRFYGVAVGRKPGVYTEWPAAQEAIVGWKGPKYKKFDTRAEAEAFVRSYSASGRPVASTAPETEKNMVDSTEEPLTKKPRTSTMPRSVRNGVLVIYTDGSSLGNGRLGAAAGVGVYFGPGDPRFVSSTTPLRQPTLGPADMSFFLEIFLSG